MQTCVNEKKSRLTLCNVLNWFVFAAIGLTFVVAASSLVLIASNDPLWLDELHTRWVIDGDWREILNRCSLGNQTPLYFYILHLLTEVIGNDVLGLRVLSVISMVAGGLLSTLFVWRRTKTISASFATAILWISSQWFLYYGSESRPYAFLIFVCLLQVICLLNAFGIGCAERDKKSKRIAFAAALVLTPTLIGIHPTAVLLIASELIVLLSVAVLCRQPDCDGKGTTRWSNFFGVVLLASSGLIGTMFLLSLGGTVANRQLWDSFSNSEYLIGQFGWSAAPIVCVLIVSFFAKWMSVRLDGLIVLSIALLVVAISIELNFVGVPIANQRYSVIAFALLPMAGGLFIGTIQNHWLRSLTSLIAILFGLFLPTTSWIVDAITQQSVRQIREEDWFGAVAEFLQNDEQEPIFLLGNVLEDSILDRDDFGASQDESLFIEYLKFPIVGLCGQSISQRVIPVPTWGAKRSDRIVSELLGRQSSRPDHSGRLASRPDPSGRVNQRLADAWLVVRMDSASFKQFSTELESKLKVAFGAEASIQDRLPSSAIVHVLKIEFVTPE